MTAYHASRPRVRSIYRLLHARSGCVTAHSALRFGFLIRSVKSSTGSVGLAARCCAHTAIAEAIDAIVFQKADESITEIITGAIIGRSFRGPAFLVGRQSRTDAW